MTFTLKSETIGAYTVSIEQEKFSSCFTVYIYEKWGSDPCLHIYRESALQIDMAGAKRTYRRYLKEVKERLA